MSQIVDRFSRLASADPRRPLIIHAAEHRIVTAADLLRLSTDLRDALDAACLPPAAPIVSAVGNRPEFVALLLACLWSKRPLLPADPGTSVSAALALATTWRAAALIGVMGADAPCLGDPMPGGLAVWRVAGESAHYERVALMKLTSGSTGLPKAILATEANLVADVQHIVEAMGIRSDDVQLAATPLSHAYALGNLVLPVVWQGTAMVLRDGFVPHRLVDDVAAHGVRVWPGVPFMFEHVLQHPPPGGLPSCLERLISAGAPLDHGVQRRFYERFGLKVQVRALKDVDALLNGIALRAGTTVEATLDDKVVFHNDSELPLSDLRRRARALGGRFQLKAYKSGYLVSNNPSLLDTDDILLSPGTSGDVLLKILCDYENRVGKLKTN